jgi:hypothetical protein
MTLLTNRNNLRDKLKIDPNGKVWGDSILNRFLNEGQREIVNDPDAQWQFSERTGFLVPASQGLSSYIQSTDDNPEYFFSPKTKQMLEMWASNGSYFNRTTLPEINNATGSAPSRYTKYAERLFLNAGYDSAASYTTLHNMDTFDGDGTWTAGSAEVTTVATDGTTYKEGAGSVSFNLDVSGTTNNYGEIYNADMTAVDISSYVLNQSAIVLWVYLPSATYFNEVSVYFGSSSTNYYRVRNNFQDCQGYNYKDGWNRIVIPTIMKETVGTPVTSAIDYLKVRLGYSSSQTDQTACRVDGIQIIDKYIQYQHTVFSTDMSADTSESIIPSEYQFVYELYAEYKAWSMLSGREDKAAQAFNEYQRDKNRMKRELLWNDTSLFRMQIVK